MPRSHRIDNARMSTRARAGLLALLLATLPGGTAPSAQDAPWWKALPAKIGTDGYGYAKKEDGSTGLYINLNYLF